jgi:Holliday junction resolvase RusA-like endonuclease
MNEILCFTVFGKPQPKQRPRFFRRGKFSGVYTPKETVAAEEAVKAAALSEKPKELITGEVDLSIVVFKETPKSFNKQQKHDAQMRLIRPTTKPDWDNYGKLVSDALNGFYWVDDGQIVTSLVMKFYAEKPCIIVTVRYNKNGGRLDDEYKGGVKIGS